VMGNGREGEREAIASSLFNFWLLAWLESFTGRPGGCPLLLLIRLLDDISQICLREFR